jgi:hypothetical protein
MCACGNARDIGAPCRQFTFGGATARTSYFRSNGRNRRIFLVDTWPGESLPTEPKAGARPRRQELLFVSNRPEDSQPPGAPRSVREPLNSYSSRCSVVSMTELPVGKELLGVAGQTSLVLRCFFPLVGSKLIVSWRNSSAIPHSPSLKLWIGHLPSSLSF